MNYQRPLALSQRLIVALISCLTLACNAESTSTSDQQGLETEAGGGGRQGGEQGGMPGGIPRGEAGDEAAGGQGLPQGAIQTGATEAGSADRGGEEEVGGGDGNSDGGAPAPPPPMPVEEEVSCLRSCVDFVECAIESCSGYGEEDTILLMEECLAVCIDPIAVAFDRLKNCNDKLRFAFTVRPDFSEFCGSASDGFCETYIATCGSWLGETACEEHYNGAPQTGEELTSGAHRACYEYHLGSAMVGVDRGDQMMVTEGCERSAGRSVCVD